MPRNIATTIQHIRLMQQIRQRFDDLAEFTTLIEYFLNKERATVTTDAILADLMKNSEMELDEDVELNELILHENSTRRLSSDFPQLLRTSTLSTVQAAFEVQLLAIARFAALIRNKEFNEPIWTNGGPTGRDPKGRIWGTKAFLTKECGITVESHHWKKIGDYINVRNAIAHGDGHITETLKNPEAAIKSAKNLAPNVELKDEKSIQLDNSATSDFANIGKFLCLALLSAASQHHK